MRLPMQRKIENPVCHLEISALVPEIFKFEKNVQTRGLMASFTQRNITIYI